MKSNYKKIRKFIFQETLKGLKMSIIGIINFQIL